MNTAETEKHKNNAVEVPKEGNMEDALKATGFGKFNIWIIFTGGLILYAMNSECWSIGYIIPSAECDMNLDLQEKTLLVTIGSIGILTTQFFWGYLADQIGRRKIMLYTLAAGCLCTVCSAFVPLYWLVVLFRFLNGTFIACGSGLCFAYVGEFFSSAHRSVAILAMSTFIGIALTLIPLLAWLIIPVDYPLMLFGRPLASWRVFVLISGLPAILACLAVWFSPESPKFLLQAQRNEEALHVLGKMHNLNRSGTENSAYPIEKLISDEEDGSVNIWELFSLKYIWKTLLVCTIQGGIFATSGGLFLWYPDILQRISSSGRDITVCQALSLNLPDVNNVMINATDRGCHMQVDSSVYIQNMLIGAAYTVGYVTISVLVGKIGIKSILITFLGTAGVATFTLHFISTPLAIDILFLALLVLSGLCVVVVNAAVVEIYPTNLRGMAVCFTMLCGRLGTIIASSLIGYLLLWNCEVTFMLFAASLISCSLLTLLLPKSNK